MIAVFAVLLASAPANTLSLDAAGPVVDSAPLTLTVTAERHSFQVIDPTSGETVSGLPLVCVSPNGVALRTVSTDWSGRLDLVDLPVGD